MKSVYISQIHLDATEVLLGVDPSDPEEFLPRSVYVPFIVKLFTFTSGQSMNILLHFGHVI